jgi:DNA-3-methyladenine glycosylase II
VHKLSELPKPKEILAYAERWRPHATTAAWYLWQAANAAKEKRPIKGVNA